MNNNTRLEINLQVFENALQTLVDSPTLDTALSANLASLQKKEELERVGEIRGNIPLKLARKYILMINTCVDEFQRMLPRMNGDAWHIDLYIEQMQGRADTISRLQTNPNYQPY
jgi:hypothetical protein